MASSIPKDRTVAAFGEVWASLDDLLAGLHDDQWALPTPLPGWTVQDNVSHIVGTEAMLSGEPGPTIDIDREASDARPQRHRRLQRAVGRVATGDDRPPKTCSTAFRRLTAARPRDAGRDERRRVERRVVHAGGQGHVRAVHADPRVRLLAPRTGHPRRRRDRPVTSRVSRSRWCSTRWRRRSASSSARRPGRRPGSGDVRAHRRRSRSFANCTSRSASGQRWCRRCRVRRPCARRCRRRDDPALCRSGRRRMLCSIRSPSTATSTLASRILENQSYTI